MLMTTSPNVMVYAALDGWPRQMVQHGHDLLDAALTLAGQLRRDIDALSGLHVLREEFLGAEASHDLDSLHVVIDVSGLGISGYGAADWLRENHHLDMGLSDHRRMEATLSLADDDHTAARLMSALTDLTKQASTLPRPVRSSCPAPPNSSSNPPCCPATRSSPRRKPSWPARRPDVSAPSRSPRTRPAYRSSSPGSASPPTPGLPAQRRQRGHAAPRRRRSHPRQDQGRQAALTGISGTRTDQMLSSCGRAAPRHLRTALGQRI